MAEVAHVFTCDRAYEDDHGRPSVTGMFDHIWSADFPFSQSQLVVAVQIVGHPHERCELMVEVLDPQHHVILSVPSHPPVSLSDIGQGFVAFTLTDTVFKTPGRYTLQISSEGHVAASKPLVLQHEPGTEVVS